MTSPTITGYDCRWDVRDNATIKAELIDRQGWPTRTAVHKAIFEYIEGWYNTRRPHSGLGYLGTNTYRPSWDCQ